MQWLINEFKQFKVDVMARVDKVVDDWAARQVIVAEDIEKLKGEIKAMKARSGKIKE